MCLHPVQHDRPASGRIGRHIHQDRQPWDRRPLGGITAKPPQGGHTAGSCGAVWQKAPCQESDVEGNTGAGEKFNDSHSSNYDLRVDWHPNARGCRGIPQSCS